MTEPSEPPRDALQFTDEPPVIPTTRVRGDPSLDFVRLLANLLDARFQVPGTPVRFGYDAMLGVVPIVGDLLGLLFGGFIVIVAAQKGVSRPVLLRMMLNLGIDTVGGAIPLVGDAFDVAWKANLRNAKLMEQALAEPEAARRSSWWILAGLSLLLLLAVGATGAFFYWVLVRIFG